MSRPRSEMTAALGRRGLMLVLSSPSGAGKTSISHKLLANDAALSLSVSATTRAPRPGEVDGKDYHFLDGAAFQRMIEAGAFLEYAQVFSRSYGTPRAPVEAVLAQGGDVLFDIDWQGHRQLAANARDDLVSVFILPPSLAALRARLSGRGQDSDEVIAERMAKAGDEMSHWGEYDYVVVNHDLDVAVAQVRAILAAERLKRGRQTGLAAFVADLQG